MIINFHKKFEKQYGKLSRPLQNRVDEKIKLFRKNPFDATLRNHALTGNMADRRAFSITGDMRIIFREHENYVLVIMLSVGTHSQVY